MLIGYARISTTKKAQKGRPKRGDQDPKLQLQALKGAGCERVFEEKASGGRWDRPVLMKALEQLRAGDVLVLQIVYFSPIRRVTTDIS